VIEVDTFSVLARVTISPGRQGSQAVTAQFGAVLMREPRACVIAEKEQ